MGLGKVLILVGIVILAIWYFQPETFESYKTKVKNVFSSSGPSGEDSGDSDNSEIINTDSDGLQDRQADGTNSYDLLEGYCVVGTECVYSAQEDCPSDLFASLSLCEEAIQNSTSSENDILREYLGKPVDAQGKFYDCKTDTNCKYDVPECFEEGLNCQCDYSKGECYIIE